MTLNPDALVVPSPSVRDIETQDGAVLLDIQQGLCLSLTQVAAKVWRLLKQNCSTNQIAEEIALEYGTAPAQVLADVLEFTTGLTQKGILRSQADSALAHNLPSLAIWVLRRHQKHRRTIAASGLKYLLMLRAFGGLIFLDLVGFRKDFARMHEFVSRWTQVPGGSCGGTVEKVCEAINKASLWYPKRVRCLQRSFVCTCLLRSCGVSAQMVIGAQKVPFKAHAWTEVDGHPVNERRDVQQIYSVWERC